MSGGQIQSNGAGGVIRGEFLENSTLTLLAYLLYNGRAMTSSDVQGFVSLNVYERSGPTPDVPIYTNTTFDNATDAVLAAPSTDGWDRGGAGYNFSTVFKSTVMTQHIGMNYRFVFNITTNSFGSMPVIFEMFCRGAT